MSGGFPVGFDLCANVEYNPSPNGNFGLTNVPTGSTANTKGTFTQLTASTTQDASWCLVTILMNGSSGDEGAVDIAVGSSGNETVVVSNLKFTMPGGTYVSYSFPLQIPAGSRVSTRAQSSSTSNTFYVGVVLFDNGFSFEGAAGVDSVGFISASSYGTLTTGSGSSMGKGAFAQLTSATTRDYLGFFVGLDFHNDAAQQYQQVVDIAIGPSGSEVIIIPDLPIGYSGPINSHFFPFPIPAATRIAARSGGAFGNSEIGVTFYGVYE